MNAQILLPEAVQNNTAQGQAAPAAPVQTPMDLVVAAIRQDSRVEASKYVDEVVVPYGGE